MISNGELQPTTGASPQQTKSAGLAADDLADLGGVMGMFRGRE